MPPTRESRGQALHYAELLTDDTAARVVVTDTQAAAKAVRERLGVQAVSWPGARSRWSGADWTPLAGRPVLVLAAASDASRKRAQAIAAMLVEDHGCRVWVGLPEESDGAGVEHWLVEDGVRAVRARIKALATAVKPRPKKAPESPPLNLPPLGWEDGNEHFRVLGLDEDRIVLRLADGTIWRCPRHRFAAPNVLVSIAPHALWGRVCGEPKISGDAARKLGEAVIGAASKRGQFDLDADPDLVGLPDGRIVDLRTGAIRDATKASDRYVAGTLGAVPEKGEPEAWLASLREAFPTHPEAIDFLRRWMGYSLTGSADEQKFLLLHGPSGTGKSTVLGVMQDVAGKYHAGINKRGLFSAHGDHLEYLARLRGMRLATVDDAPATGWRVQDITSLVSGEMTTARGMGQGSMDFRAAVKIVMTSNHLPEVSSPGLERRILPLEMRQIVSDTRRRGALRKELPQIVAWAIQGAREWYESGLMPTGFMEAAAVDFAQVADRIGAWMGECLEIDPGYRCTVRELQTSYREWSDGGRLSARALRTYLAQHGYGDRIAPAARHGTAYGYVGCRVRAGGPDAPPPMARQYDDD